MKATVFYEDAPGVAVTNFGPHLLALACVADRMGVERYLLRHYADAVPMKGDSKLRAVLKGIAGRHTIALFDSDHVRDLYGLEKGATTLEVIAAIKAETGSEVEVILLERNAEDLIRHCHVAMQEALPSGKPTPEERDRVLHRMAARAPSDRERLRQLCPSFALLADTLQKMIERIRAEERPG